MLSQRENKTLQEIREGHIPVCLHILGQPLVEELCRIIKHQSEQIEEYELRDGANWKPE